MYEVTIYEYFDEAYDALLEGGEIIRYADGSPSNLIVVNGENETLIIDEEKTMVVKVLDNGEAREDSLLAIWESACIEVGGIGGVEHIPEEGVALYA